MRFIGNASRLYEHARSQMYGCEFICRGILKAGEEKGKKQDKYQTCCRGEIQMWEATKCT